MLTTTKGKDMSGIPCGYRYCKEDGEPLLCCQNCCRDLTRGDAIELVISIGGQVCEITTQLDEAACLVDVESVVAHGYHSETLCRACAQSLVEYEEEQ
jgi:hypothetical protein